MTMKLWITAAGTEFLKDKLASKNKNKEAPTELWSQIYQVLEHLASKPKGDSVI
jgi:hypothetical protein